MAYITVDESGNALGFSLRPPKWLRKAQPGKILKKAALPLAVIGGALLIPGVGGAIAAGLKFGAVKAGGAALRLAKGAPSAMRSRVVSRTVERITLPPMPSPVPHIEALPTGVPMPAMTAMSVQPMTSAPYVPSGAGAAVMDPSAVDSPSAASAGEMPGWVIPAALGLGLFVFMRKK